MNDIDRIIVGLEIIRFIDPPIEVELGDGYIESGWDMPPDSILPEQLEALLKAGWEYKYDPVCSYWRLTLV